ncbi:hypothetical protein BGX29_009721 [Mortierella sp. GBA35]|nr:hypothetical protein BGX29_009721 [Mortierella sp. GBA35]
MNRQSGPPSNNVRSEETESERQFEGAIKMTDLNPIYFERLRAFERPEVLEIFILQRGFGIKTRTDLDLSPRDKKTKT